MSATWGAAGGPSGAAPQRPGAGQKKWSEVRSVVQQPDGSVRTSPPFKSGPVASAASPARPRRPAGGGSIGLRRPSRNSRNCLGVPTAAAGGASGRSSRGGSSGKSSRNSSLDIARDGDISSRCSSGCWETSTNDSEPSRPRTPPDAAPSPFTAKGLLAPDPIRTSLLLPPALIDDDNTVDESTSTKVSDSTSIPLEEIGEIGDNRPGLPLKFDPFGRDGTRRVVDAKGKWSVEPVIKYLKDVARQIDTNLRDERLSHREPTTDRLDTYVHRLVANTQRQLKHAPRKVRHPLQALFSKRFQKFWNFLRNEKVRSTTPEELKIALAGLIESLTSEFAMNQDICTLEAAILR